MLTESRIIADGVKLNYIKTDKFKTNYISINFISPLSKERAYLNSLLPMVLMRGSEKYPSQIDINKRLQYLYSVDIVSRNSEYGEYHVFGFKANMLNNRFADDVNITDETINLLCDMAFNPLLVNGMFDENYVEGEKTSLVDIIESEINNKGRYAINRLKSEMFKDEVFSVSKLGTVDSVKSVTSEQLYSYFKRVIKELPIEIYFVGECDFEAVANKFREVFSSIERSPITIPTVDIVTEVSKVNQIVEKENVNQGKLVLGFRTCYRAEENKYHLMQLFNEIYGGSPTAKLFTNVREKLSLCYTCRSIISQRLGAMIVSSGIEAKNKEIAESAIIEQLEAIKRGEMSELEFNGAKKSLTCGYMQIYDSAEGMENWAFFRGGLCGINTTPLNEMEKVNNATQEDIMLLANRMKLDTVYFLKGLGESDE